MSADTGLDDELRAHRSFIVAYSALAETVERIFRVVEFERANNRHTFASHWVLDGGDIFRLSKSLGHSSVVITQRTYAHLAPEAWQQDYHRVTFVIPSDDVEYGKTKRKRPPLVALDRGRPLLRAVSASGVVW